ncbi:Unknown protein, partial [Striga hermonthica]
NESYRRVIFVHMSIDKPTRECQWRELENRKSGWGDRWCAIGDWNDVAKVEDKKGGRQRSQASLMGFQSFIANLGMTEVHRKGYTFTWGNNRVAEGFVEEALDVGYASLVWLQDYPLTQTTTMFKSSSDHHMLLLEDEPPNQQAKRRFQFDKRWLSREGVKDVIQATWEGQIGGTPMFSLKEKVKKTRVALLNWSKYFRANEKQHRENLTLQLKEMREAEGQRNWEEWDRLQKEMDEANKSEELFWQQKARVEWLREGEQNTHFYHAWVTQRRRTNSISRLITEQQRICESKEEIEKHVECYYANLFTSEADKYQAQVLLSILSRYHNFSGQKVNTTKSSIFFSKNTNAATQREACAIFPRIQVQKSSRYLGMPLGIGKLKKEVFSFVTEAVRKRVISWKNKFLFAAGKEVLIKSVLNALPLF